MDRSGKEMMCIDTESSFSNGIFEKMEEIRKRTEERGINKNMDMTRKMTAKFDLMMKGSCYPNQ